MKQPLKSDGKIKRRKKVVRKANPFIKRKHITNQKYGTSKLEKDFAKNFLDKLGLVYIYQYEAKSIKRFYDFAVTCVTEKDYIMEMKEGIKCVKQDGQSFQVDLLIEIDGDYYHGNPNKYTNEDLTPMQKHNKFIDKLKTQWAGLNCITLLRFWEDDIRNNPQKVIDELLKYVNINQKKRLILENKKKPH